MKSKLIYYTISLWLFALPPIAGADTPFGVIVGGKGRLPNIVLTLKDLQVSWVRVNYTLGSPTDIKRYLDAGINIVITFSNEDRGNMDTSLGAPGEFPNAGYPFKSREVYQNDIRKALAPLLPYLAEGRRIYAQCENEVGDANLNPRSRYWRGTLDQYLAQLDAFYEAVRSVNPSISVVLTSFASETLDAFREADNPHHTYAVNRIKRLLSEGKYDVVDLHFYGCPEDIAKKVSEIKNDLPAGKSWISTENGGPDSRCPATPYTWQKNPDKYEDIQARQVAQRLTACRENGGDVCLWFSLMDLRKEAEVFSHMGLLGLEKVSGNRAALKNLKQKINAEKILSADEAEKASSFLRPKPAYESFKSFIQNYGKK